MSSISNNSGSIIGSEETEARKNSKDSNAINWDQNQSEPHHHEQDKINDGFIDEKSNPFAKPDEPSSIEGSKVSNDDEEVDGFDPARNNYLLSKKDDTLAGNGRTNWQPRSVPPGFGGFQDQDNFKVGWGQYSDFSNFGNPYQSNNWNRGGGFSSYSQNSMYLGSGGFNSLYPPYPRSSGGLSRESSRDDLTSMGDGQIFEHEERFTVDRRKLELLMTGNFDLIKESAADFFFRIGNETNSTVIWPSRLKIGAKTKKDPHIRVGGSEPSVRKAKARILECLGMRSERVTMKMDVSYTDHSHVIGKGGNTIRRVMGETGCHIHFPDSNRSNPHEKSNQVSIAGEIDGVETARQRIRELTPLIFCFDLPIMHNMQYSQHAPDANDSFLRAIQDQYNIQVTFRQKHKNFHTWMVIVKGSESEAARVKESTLVLMNHFCLRSSDHANPEAQFVTMNMEISPQHHSIVLGKGNMTLRLIMDRTKTTILFPDASDNNIPPIRKGSVQITGSIHNVYLARQQLIGSLPLVMMFDINDESKLDERQMQKMQIDYDVSIVVKPKMRQSTKSIVIKAQERNAGSIYKVRCLLLGLNEIPTKANIPESYIIRAISSSGTTLPVNHRAFAPSLDVPLPPSPNAYGSFKKSINNNNNNNKLPYLDGFSNQGNNQPPPLSSSPNVGSPAFFPPPHPFAGALTSENSSNQVSSCPNSPSYNQNKNPSPYSWGHSNIMAPNDPHLKYHVKRVLNNLTREYQQHEHQNDLLKSRRRSHPVIPTHREFHSDNNNNNDIKDIIVNNNFLNSDLNLHSPPIPGTSPRNSSPVREDGNLTSNFAKLDCTGGEHSGTSGIGTSNASTDKGCLTTSSNTSSVCCHDNNNDQKTDYNNILGDRRAPGCEKEISSMLFKYGELTDYDQKKVMATRAKFEKLTGKVIRKPNSTWSGLGFSSSMPENVIRQQLEDQSILKNQILDCSRNQDSILEESNELSPYLPLSPDPINSNLLNHSNDIENPKRGSLVDREKLFFGNSTAYGLFTSKSDNNWIGPDDDLSSIFARRGFSKYTEMFARQEIDLNTFATLTDDDLKEIGVQTFGARKKLLLLINETKQVIKPNPNW